MNTSIGYENYLDRLHNFIYEAGDDGISIFDLAEKMGQSEHAIRSNAAVLVNRGLVSRSFNGNHYFYEAVPEPRRWGQTESLTLKTTWLDKALEMFGLQKIGR